MCLLPEQSVAAEEVAGVDFLLYVVEHAVIAVGYDGIAAALEFFDVVYYKASEKCGAVFKCGFIDDYLSSFGLDALHHALD